jgi:hypothetical protein
MKLLDTLPAAEICSPAITTANRRLPPSYGNPWNTLLIRRTGWNLGKPLRMRQKDTSLETSYRDLETFYRGKETFVRGMETIVWRKETFVRGTETIVWPISENMVAS